MNTSTLSQGGRGVELHVEFQLIVCRERLKRTLVIRSGLTSSIFTVIERKEADNNIIRRELVKLLQQGPKLIRSREP